MPDILSAMREFRSLDDKRRSSGLGPAEEARWQELRSALKGPGSAAPHNEAPRSAPAPEPRAPEPPPPAPAIAAPEVPEGYQLDEGSGYLWHEHAQHWFDPRTGVYFDADGNGIDPAVAQAEAAHRPAPPVEPIVADLGGNPDEPVELATQADFLDHAARVNEAVTPPMSEALDLPEDDGNGTIELATAAELAQERAELPEGRVRRRDRPPPAPAGPAEWDPDRPDTGAWDAAAPEARVPSDATDPRMPVAPPAPVTTETGAWSAPPGWGEPSAVAQPEPATPPPAADWEAAATQPASDWEATPAQPASQWDDAAAAQPTSAWDAAASARPASGQETAAASPLTSEWGATTTEPASDREGASAAQPTSDWEAVAAQPASDWEAVAAQPTSEWDAAAAPPASDWEAAAVAQPTSEWDATPAAQAASRWDATPAAQAASGWDAAPAAQPTSGWDAAPATQATSEWDAAAEEPASEWTASDSPQPGSEWQAAGEALPSSEWVATEPAQADPEWQGAEPAAEIAVPGVAEENWATEAAAATPSMPAPGQTQHWDAPPAAAWSAPQPAAGPSEWTPTGGVPAPAGPAAASPAPPSRRGEVPWDATPTNPGLQDAPTGKIVMGRPDASSAWSSPGNLELTPVESILHPPDDLDVIDPSLITPLADEAAHALPSAVDVLDDLDVAVETTPTAPQQLALPPGADDFDSFAPAVVPDPPPRPRPMVVVDPMLAASPGYVAGRHRVVIHTLGGMTRRGEVHEIDLEADSIALAGAAGTERVPTSDVKAVFFMLAPGERPPAPKGVRVKVTFQDGREVPGFATPPGPTERGFFLHPADARTNTARIYVYRDAIREMVNA